MTIKIPRLRALPIAALLLASGSLHALTFDPNDHVQIRTSTVLSYSLAWRTEKPAHALSGRYTPKAANRDDGNNAFKRGSLVTNRIGILSDADFRWRRDQGVFVRASAYYDDVYHQRNDNRSGTSNCFAAGECSRPDRFSGKTVDAHGGDVRILDAYVYGNWNMAGNPLNVRIGRQVVSWGESLYNGSGIASAMNPVDAGKSSIPGTEVKERLLPTGQLFAQYGVSESLDLQLYYQYEWQKTELNAVGSYFSATDFIDKGGFSDANGQLLRLSDDEPRDSGQYGVALRYLAEHWNNTEFGLYRLRFHSKTPQLDFLSHRNERAYKARYFEDIDLYGGSFATTFGDTAVSGEISYQNGQPIAVQAAQATQFVRGKTGQVLLSVIHPVGTTPLADNLTLNGEVGYNRVLDHDRIEQHPNSALSNDRSAWGYTLSANLRYIGVVPGWDLSVPISFNQNVRGVSSLGTYREGANRFSIGSTWEYLGNFAIEARYNVYLGSPTENPLTDRDHLSLTARYSF